MLVSNSVYYFVQDKHCEGVGFRCRILWKSLYSASTHFGETFSWYVLLFIHSWFLSLSFSVANLSSVRGFVQIPRFKDDPSLCPVRTLQEYLNKVSFPWFKQTNKQTIWKWNRSIPAYPRFLLWGVRSADCFFLLCRHICQCLLAPWPSGSPATWLWLGSIQPSSSSTLLKKANSINQLCSIACWSSVSGVFQKFYARYF